MIDDHLMPSGEPAGPAPNRRNRNLETLGGSTRLELGVGGVMRVLSRRGLLLIGIYVVAFAVIYAGSGLLAKRYSSVAWVRISDESEAIFVEAGKSVDLTKEQRAVIVSTETPRLRAALKRELGPDFKNVGSVVATGLEASPLIRIDATASSPALAERAANTGLAVVVDNSRTRARQSASERAANLEASAVDLEAEVTDLSTRLEGVLPTDPDSTALKAKLDASTAALSSALTEAALERTEATSAAGGLRQFEAGTRPIDSEFPQPMSWAILGSLAVLLMAVAAVYGREELAGRFRSGDSSESRRAGTRVLGVLPRPGGGLPRGVVTGAGTSVDEVGLQLVHLLGRSKANVVLLCSVDGPAPEATARRVAQAIAESGARVVYAACRGVSAAGTDDEFEAPVPRARLSVVHEQQTGGRLRVLDDGIAAGDLTVARARTVLHRLTEQCEYVVVAGQSPTVEPATLVLAELADATVMIAQHGVTKLRDAERAGTRLRRVGGAVLGVVVDPAKSGPKGVAPTARAAGVSAG